jgi:hypothetical protein
MKGTKGDIAVLYRAMVSQGVPIVHVNQMELWEVAVQLGLDEDQRPRLVSKGEKAPGRLEDLPLSDRKRIEQARKRKAERIAVESQPGI